MVPPTGAGAGAVTVGICAGEAVFEGGPNELDPAALARIYPGLATGASSPSGEPRRDPASKALTL